ncbi:hypothetical protein QL995_20950 [Pseudoalteromonas sp. APC 3358]|uniref:hypothetical protein n=1 Tax=Pseudoalteromonas sp. APC 3358 TaxID=3035176 RepID=UPI0025B2FE9F|nr:hypothetical protein [Pseudoalteromonas sp. APC 3358]MDN3385097.1 hypothetical protein [Pseudoalteromonas sp. APC 3358]
MAKIIQIDFRAQQKKRAYSADVYSHDRKKYRFEVDARSINEAYYEFIGKAMAQGIAVIRCIAIYLGWSCQRSPYQTPVKVWQQYDPAVGSLTEF